MEATYLYITSNPILRPHTVPVYIEDITEEQRWINAIIVEASPASKEEKAFLTEAITALSDDPLLVEMFLYEGIFGSLWNKTKEFFSKGGMAIASFLQKAVLAAFPSGVQIELKKWLKGANKSYKKARTLSYKAFAELREFEELRPAIANCALGSRELHLNFKNFFELLSIKNTTDRLLGNETDLEKVSTGTARSSAKDLIRNLKHSEYDIKNRKKYPWPDENITIYGAETGEQDTERALKRYKRFNAAAPSNLVSATLREEKGVIAILEAAMEALEDAALNVAHAAGRLSSLPKAFETAIDLFGMTEFYKRAHQGMASILIKLMESETVNIKDEIVAHTIAKTDPSNAKMFRLEVRKEYIGQLLANPGFKLERKKFAKAIKKVTAAYMQSQIDTTPAEIETKPSIDGIPNAPKPTASTPEPSTGVAVDSTQKDPGTTDQSNQFNPLRTPINAKGTAGISLKSKTDDQPPGELESYKFIEDLSDNIKRRRILMPMRALSIATLTIGEIVTPDELNKIKPIDSAPKDLLTIVRNSTSTAFEHIRNIASLYGHPNANYATLVEKRKAIDPDEKLDLENKELPIDQFAVILEEALKKARNSMSAITTFIAQKVKKLHPNHTKFQREAANSYKLAESTLKVLQKVIKRHIKSRNSLDDSDSRIPIEEPETNPEEQEQPIKTPDSPDTPNTDIMENPEAIEAGDAFFASAQKILRVPPSKYGTKGVNRSLDKLKDKTKKLVLWVKNAFPDYIPDIELSDDASKGNASPKMKIKVMTQALDELSRTFKILVKTKNLKYRLDSNEAFALKLVSLGALLDHFAKMTSVDINAVRNQLKKKKQRAQSKRKRSKKNKA